jgi:hypothetical protein
LFIRHAETLATILSPQKKKHSSRPVPVITSRNDNDVDTRPDGRVSICPNASPEKTDSVEGWRSEAITIIGHAETGGKWVTERGCEGRKERDKVRVREEGSGDRERHHRDNGEVGEIGAVYALPSFLALGRF